MLSFASAAYTADKALVATFAANLETLPDAAPHSKTADAIEDGALFCNMLNANRSDGDIK